MKGFMGRLAAPSRKTALTLDQLPGFLLDAGSKTGVSVTWWTALQVTAMFACCRVVGEDLAAARCRLFKPKAGGGDMAASDDPLFRLLFLEPSAGLTAFGFWETIVFHVMLVGNAFVFVNRVGDGRIHELILLEPGKVRVVHNADHSLDYDLSGPGGGFQRLPRDAIWHVRGPSWNGWMGMETVKLAREALGLSLALEASHAELHADGVKTSGFYSIDAEFTADQHKQMIAQVKRYASGGDRVGSPLILDRGAKWLNQQMSGVDLQHLETRRFQIEEVCRAARVMPIMVMQSEKTAAYASSEQMFLAHRQQTLAGWAGRVEQSAEVALLSPAQKNAGFTIRFNLNAGMRGDYKSRQEGLLIQRRAGIINANEWRALEDMNPREDAGGPQYIVESNMALQDGRDLPGATAPAKTSGATA